ncbi:uncharacterized protein VP01_276g8 [Puccinia sorghi]|uniref:Retrotransposon gag domain-containing protein n=1 Tax=Puccinia sorghi TaxID=27349 RepID=A0A0L6V2V5_9BASI|nr:uncharacterized protein VP01_276g8 [Puccinia sorghi]
MTGTATPNPRVLAKPKPFNRTHGTASELFFGHIGLHAITKCFPTNPRKVSFVILLMTDYTANWYQLYLTKVFNWEAVVFSNLIDDLKSSFFDHNCQHHAEQFNLHACTIGWADSPLMRLYQHRLKENIRLDLVMSKIQFNSLRDMQAMALKEVW